MAKHLSTAFYDKETFTYRVTNLRPIEQGNRGLSIDRGATTQGSETAQEKMKYLLALQGPLPNRILAALP